MAEFAVDPLRETEYDCSRDDDGRSGTLCFSSLLQFCLWPGRCNRDEVEFFDALLLVVSDGKNESVAAGTFCRSVSPHRACLRILFYMHTRIGPGSGCSSIDPPHERTSGF